jgi:ferric hydroxamate transport system ATP-binding protein
MELKDALGRCEFTPGSSVVVLHDINMAGRFCDEIIALSAGELIARGPPKSVITPRDLESIYGVKMNVLSHPEGDYPVSYT